jgi:hypothetical protein
MEEWANGKNVWYYERMEEWANGQSVWYYKWATLPQNSHCTLPSSSSSIFQFADAEWLGSK